MPSWPSSAGGVLASSHSLGGGKPLQQLVIVIIVATLGEVLGSAAGCSIGRFGGRTLVDRVGKYVLLTHKDLEPTEAWFARRGEPVVLIGRFIPLVRSFAFSSQPDWAKWRWPSS